VLVYAYDNEFPEKQRLANDLLNKLITSGQAVISTQILAEFYIACTSKIAHPLTPAEALRSIDRYTQCLIIVSVTPAVVREAVRIRQACKMSFWDAQIWAAAHLNQIPLIISEDTPGAKIIEGIRYHNPFTSAEGMEE